MNRRRIVYAGIDLEADLRDWLVHLAKDLDQAAAASAPGAASAAVPKHRLRAAADVVRRAAAMPALSGLFPDRLSHRRQTGRPYWMVVDAIDAGERQRAAVAKRWGVKPETLDRYVREIGDTVRFGHEFPLTNEWRAELAHIRRLLAKQHRK